MRTSLPVIREICKSPGLAYAEQAKLAGTACTWMHLCQKAAVATACSPVGNLTGGRLTGRHKALALSLLVISNDCRTRLNAAKVYQGVGHS